MTKNMFIFSLFLLASFTCFFAGQEATSPEEIDAIVSIVSSAAGTEIITKSDLKRPTIFGKFRTIEECELEKATLLYAKQHQIYVDDDMVESYFASIEKAYNITRQEVQQMFIDAGYTISEGVEQLRNSQVINIILQKEIYEKISVSIQEIASYFAEFPTFTSPEVTLCRATREDKNNEIDINQLSINQFQFSDAITLQISEISPEHRFILDLKPGQIHIEKKDDVIEAIHVISKTNEKLISLEERTNEIMSTLREQKFGLLFENYKEKVLKLVTVIRM